MVLALHVMSHQEKVLLSFVIWKRRNLGEKYSLFGQNKIVRSFSRSVVNYNARAWIAISNIVKALVILVTLLLLVPLFYYILNLVLVAIIIIAVTGLINYQTVSKLWKVDN